MVSEKNHMLTVYWQETERIYFWHFPLSRKKNKNKNAALQDINFVHKTIS